MIRVALRSLLPLSYKVPNNAQYQQCADYQHMVYLHLSATSELNEPPQRSQGIITTLTQRSCSKLDILMTFVTLPALQVFSLLKGELTIENRESLLDAIELWPNVDPCSAMRFQSASNGVRECFKRIEVFRGHLIAPDAVTRHELELEGMSAFSMRHTSRN